jgi:hypothetical protein
MKKTYMIHEDNSYTGGLSAKLLEFVGTERQMLEYLSGGNNEDPDPGERRFPSEFTDAELRTMIEEANGDGANVTTVFEDQGVFAEGRRWKCVIG